MVEQPADSWRAMLASRACRKLGELTQARDNLAANKETEGPYHQALKSAVQVAEEEYAAAAALVDAHDKAHEPYDFTELVRRIEESRAEDTKNIKIETRCNCGATLFLDIPATLLNRFDAEQFVKIATAFIAAHAGHK